MDNKGKLKKKNPVFGSWPVINPKVKGNSFSFKEKDEQGFKDLCIQLDKCKITLGPKDYEFSLDGPLEDSDESTEHSFKANSVKQRNAWVKFLNREPTMNEDMLERMELEAKIYHYSKDAMKVDKVTQLRKEVEEIKQRQKDKEDTKRQEEEEKLKKEMGIDDDNENLMMQDFIFATHRKGLLNRKIKTGEAVSKTDLMRHESTIIKKAILKSNRDIDAKAIQCFKNILSYMGDRVSSKLDPNQHARKTLRNILSAPAPLRDEAYMQLIKQTTSNNDKSSREKGWELFLFFTVTFPPSQKLKPYLLRYFEKHIRSQISEVTCPMAEIAYENCRKIADFGARKHPPSSEELNALRKLEPLSVNVYLLNFIFDQKSFKVIKVNSFQTVGDVEEELVRKMKVKGGENGELCGLYEEFATNRERHLIEKDRLVDVLGEWEEVPNENYPDPRLIWRMKLVMPNSIKEITDEKEFINMLYIQACHDVYTERYPIRHRDITGLAALQLLEKHGDSGAATEDWVKEQLCEILPRAYLKGISKKFLEGKGVRRMDYLANRLLKENTTPEEEENIPKSPKGDNSSRCVSNDRARRNSVTKEQKDYLDVDDNVTRDRRQTKGARRKSISAIVPSTWVDVDKEKKDWVDAWVKGILQKYKSMCGNYYSPFDAKMNYLDQCQTWRLYGATVWSVKQSQWSNFPDPVNLAITHHGLYFVHPKRLLVLRTFQFNEVVTWGFTNETLILFVGDILQKQKLNLKTSNGRYISALIGDYISFIIDNEGDQAIPPAPRDDPPSYDDEMLDFLQNLKPPAEEKVPKPPITKNTKTSS